MSKRIFQATLSDPDVPDASAEAEHDEEPGKSRHSSFDSEGQQSPLKSSKAKGQRRGHEEDSPPPGTAKGQAPGVFCLFLL